MDDPLKADVRVFADPAELSRKAAAQVVAWIREDVGRRGGCALALAGGSTPRALYGLLAREHAERIPWSRVHLFWGDERYVPWTSRQSNYRMVHDTLLVHVPLPPDNAHPMPTDYDRPQEAAMAYESVLQTHFSEHWPRFDLVLLGVGTDGHTASLFPGSLALGERERRVVATTAPAHPRQRLTLTLPVLNRAARVCFLVAGEEKAEALRCAVERPEDPAEAACPAGSVRPIDGALHWFIDREAASLLEAGKGV